MLNKKRTKKGKKKSSNEIQGRADCNRIVIIPKDNQKLGETIRCLITDATRNVLKGTELKKKLNSYTNINYKESIEEAIRSIPVKENDIILITGSLYLAGEVLNLN